MEYPTLAIQLSNDNGTGPDLPDDWLDTVMSIVTMLHAKYNTGIDIVYGMATKEGLIIIEQEVE